MKISFVQHVFLEITEARTNIKIGKTRIYYCTIKVINCVIFINDD